jgi:hypothetical protein
MKKLIFILVLILSPLILLGQHRYLKNVTVSDSVFITKLATSETKVLSPTSTGGTTVLETVLGTAITWSSLTADAITVTNDINVGDTIGFDNGAKIYNPHADTIYIEETVVTINGILAATGNISGTTDLTLDIAATIVLTTADCRNKVRFNNDADVIDYTLPGAAAGLVVVFYDIGGGVITIDPVDGTDTIYLNGTSVGAGDAIDSPGSVGDFICLMAIDDTRWVTVGRSGTWVDGGVD